MSSFHPLSFGARLAVLAGVTITSVSGLPDAGQLTREQQAMPAPKASKELLPQVETRAKETVTGGATIQVNDFRFVGFAELASEAELKLAVTPWVGRSLNMGELQHAAAKVTELLRQKGLLLTRAYLPKQEVVGGVVEIAVLRAQVDSEVGVKSAPTNRLSENTLKGIASSSVRPGEPVRDSDLEKMLMLVNALPGVQARAILEQGTVPGSTHVSIEANEGALFNSLLWADNYGNRYSGAWRGNALLTLNDPTGHGDSGSFLASASDKLQQGRLVYITPLGSQGLKTGVSATAMRYELGKEFAALDAKGTSTTINLWGNQPIILRRTIGLAATAGYEYKQLKDEALKVTLHRRVVNSGSLGINGYLRDGFLGGGYTSWSLTGTFGDADYSRVRTDEDGDRLTAGAAGTYTRLNFTLSRQQRLTSNWMLTLSSYGQLAFDNLDSSEKFTLGGPNGVRAYPVGEASGDEGFIVNAELSRNLQLSSDMPTLQLVGFVDAGGIKLHNELWKDALSNATNSNSYTLAGAGFGINATFADSFTLRFNYAFKIGDNPGRSLQGNDADGHSFSGRFWIAAQYSY